ncbi:2-amino-3-carboxymuconate-6-semialdehyde decarboxylase [Tricladium varicosporioides]|nr:2-amino-3-carboxymuconate-6-semialdehyde decarboxylase [Hymenoscyphus varicosporioides]
MTHFITLEEHYVSKRVRQASAKDPLAVFPQILQDKLHDLGDGRIKDLDNGGISIQVLSHGPVEVDPTLSREVNDELAIAVSKNPTRLAGFAVLPMGEPAAAAEELSRCVRQHGFVGALIDNHFDGEFYDGEKFLPVFEKAQELDVPIYIHPTFAPNKMMDHYKGNYDDMAAFALSAFGWSWHAETGLHFLKLFASGLFDRFPRLKIIIGHMGELLPFQLARIASGASRWAKTERQLMDVWKSNIWVTTSGMFTLPPLACLLQTTTIDHVLYSVDYPFSANELGKEFAEKIRTSGLMSEEEFQQFAYKNAEALLKIKVHD